MILNFVNSRLGRKKKKCEINSDDSYKQCSRSALPVGRTLDIRKKGRFSFNIRRCNKNFPTPTSSRHICNDKSLPKLMPNSGTFRCSKSCLPRSNNNGCISSENRCSRISHDYRSTVSNSKNDIKKMFPFKRHNQINFIESIRFNLSKKMKNCNEKICVTGKDYLLDVGRRNISHFLKKLNQNNLSKKIISNSISHSGRDSISNYRISDLSQELYTNFNFDELQDSIKKLGNSRFGNSFYPDYVPIDSKIDNFTVMSNKRSLNIMHPKFKDVDFFRKLKILSQKRFSTHFADSKRIIESIIKSTITGRYFVPLIKLNSKKYYRRTYQKNRVIFNCRYRAEKNKSNEFFKSVWRQPKKKKLKYVTIIFFSRNQNFLGKKIFLIGYIDFNSKKHVQSSNSMFISNFDLDPVCDTNRFFSAENMSQRSNKNFEKIERESQFYTNYTFKFSRLNDEEFLNDSQFIRISDTRDDDYDNKLFTTIDGIPTIYFNDPSNKKHLFCSSESQQNTMSTDHINDRNVKIIGYFDIINGRNNYSDLNNGNVSIADKDEDKDAMSSTKSHSVETLEFGSRSIYDNFSFVSSLSGDKRNNSNEFDDEFIYYDSNNAHLANSIYGHIKTYENVSSHALSYNEILTNDVNEIISTCGIYEDNHDQRSHTETSNTQSIEFKFKSVKEEKVNFEHYIKFNEKFRNVKYNSNDYIHEDSKEIQSMSLDSSNLVHMKYGNDCMNSLQGINLSHLSVSSSTENVDLLHRKNGIKNMVLSGTNISNSFISLPSIDSISDLVQFNFNDPSNSTKILSRKHDCQEEGRTTEINSDKDILFFLSKSSESVCNTCRIRCKAKAALLNLNAKVSTGIDYSTLDCFKCTKRCKAHQNDINIKNLDVSTTKRNYSTSNDRCINSSEKPVEKNSRKYKKNTSSANDKKKIKNLKKSSNREEEKKKKKGFQLFPFLPSNLLGLFNNFNFPRGIIQEQEYNQSKNELDQKCVEDAYLTFHPSSNRTDLLNTDMDTGNLPTKTNFSAIIDNNDPPFNNDGIDYFINGDCFDFVDTYYNDKVEDINRLCPLSNNDNNEIDILDNSVGQLYLSTTEYSLPEEVSTAFLDTETGEEIAFDDAKEENICLKDSIEFLATSCTLNNCHVSAFLDNLDYLKLTNNDADDIINRIEVSNEFSEKTKFYKKCLSLSNMMIGRWETILSKSSPLDPLFKQFGISYFKRVIVDKIAIPLTIFIEDSLVLKVIVHLPVGNRQMSWRLDGEVSDENDPDCGIWSGYTRLVTHSIPFYEEGRQMYALQQVRKHEKIGIVHETRAILKDPNSKSNRLLYLNYTLFPKKKSSEKVEVTRILKWID